VRETGDGMIGMEAGGGSLVAGEVQRAAVEVPFGAPGGIGIRTARSVGGYGWLV